MQEKLRDDMTDLRVMKDKLFREFFSKSVGRKCKQLMLSLPGQVDQYSANTKKKMLPSFIYCMIGGIRLSLQKMKVLKCPKNGGKEDNKN